MTVHDGLTLAVGKATLKPGEEYEITLHVQSAPDAEEVLTVRRLRLSKAGGRVELKEKSPLYMDVRVS